ncbi:MAG: TldD/PmbA family protein [Chloroflexi bacterium]|nr:MAG: TldD/PmbA family protein [Chloroflexota bacterium]
MIVQQIIEKAMQKAQAAQAVLINQETSAVEFDNDLLKSGTSSQRTEIRLKVILDGKVGNSTTTDLKDIDGIVARALEAAEFGSPAYFEMPSTQQLTDVKTFDPDLLPLAKPEMIHFGKQMMDMIKSYNPDILASAGLNKTIYSIEYANSAGAVYTSDHTDYSVGAGGALVRGTDILYAGHGLGQKKRSIDTEDIAERAIEYFRMAEQIVPVKSGVMPVVFTPSGLALLLLSVILGIDGKNVFLGTSPLRDRLGQSIADSRLTIIDNPFLDYGPRSSAFDDEGTPRQVTPIVENGQLKNFIYDRDTAGRVGVQSTGHGSTRTLTNLVIQPGETAYSQMIANIKEGLLVHEYLGIGQGNPINGEFSVNVYLGYKIENGKVTGRIKDVMLAGNAYEALKNITAISKEQEWVGGGYNFFSGLVPFIQVGGLSVTAK